MLERLQKLGHWILSPFRTKATVKKTHNLAVIPNHINAEHEPVPYIHFKYYVMSKDQLQRRKKGKAGRLQNKKRMLQSKK